MQVVAVFLLLVSMASAQGLRAGAAKVVITPPKGAPMAGYYVTRIAEGTHDDLYAKAIVFDQGGTKIAMAAVDVVFLPRPVIEKAREIIQQKIGLAPDHVMISATHDHTGPVIMTVPSRYNLEGEVKRIVQDYTDALPGKIAQAVIDANRDLQPAVIRAGIGRENTLAYNRRYFMKNGTVGWNPGKMNPNILREAGPIDPAVPVVYIETTDGKGIAAYVNFAMHQDTTGGLKFSADFSYTIGRVLHMAKGPNVISMFTIGCAGNVNHLNFFSKEPQSSYEEAARIGAVLGGDALKVIESAPVIPVHTIEASTRVLKLDLPQFTPDEVAWANRVQATFNTPHQAPFLDLVRAAKIIDIESRNGRPFNAEVQVFTLGDQLAFVGFPGEMFTEFGLTLKEDSPFPITIAAELADGGLGYIPNRQAYPQGQYEVVSTRLKPGAGEKLMNAALDQLDILFRKERQALAAAYPAH